MDLREGNTHCSVSFLFFREIISTFSQSSETRVALSGHSYIVFYNLNKVSLVEIPLASWYNVEEATMSCSWPLLFSWLGSVSAKVLVRPRGAGKDCIQLVGYTEGCY